MCPDRYNSTNKHKVLIYAELSAVYGDIKYAQNATDWHTVYWLSAIFINRVQTFHLWEWMRTRKQMFNVQSKTDQEVGLVYCTNQTKRLMGKTLKRKPWSSPESVKAVRWKGGVYGGKDFWKR